MDLKTKETNDKQTIERKKSVYEKEDEEQKMQQRKNNTERGLRRTS